jgi:inner membrane protein
MASPFTHAVVAATLAASYRFRPPAGTFWAVGILCAILPDLDAVGFWLGVPYGSFWGHRGITHSIAFAAVVSAVLARSVPGWTGTGRVRLWTYCFLATLSHGVLDALTDGGLGVAFLSPFDQGRYFFPVRPIRVSSMSVRDLLGPHGLDVLRSEIVSVWIPCGVIAIAVLWLRSRRRISSSE